MIVSSELWVLRLFLLSSVIYKAGQYEDSEIIIETTKFAIDDRLWYLKWQMDNMVDDLMNSIHNIKTKILMSVQSALNSFPDMFECVILMGVDKLPFCDQIVTNEILSNININDNSIIFKVTCFGRILNQLRLLTNDMLLLRNKVDRAVAYGSGAYTDKCDFIVGHHLKQCIKDSLMLFKKDYNQYKYKLKQMKMQIIKRNTVHFSKTIALCKHVYCCLHLSYLSENHNLELSDLRGDYQGNDTELQSEQ